MKDQGVVAIARTQVRPSPQAANALVRQALGLLGGIGAFVVPGQQVFIKPDLSLGRLAHEGATADPWVVAALVHLCLEAGARRVLVGEIPRLRLDSRWAMLVTGMAEAVRQAGGEPVRLEGRPYQDIAVPRGRVVQRVLLPEVVLQSDVRIAVAKGKTGLLDPISGAIEGWRGIIPWELRALYSGYDALDHHLDTMAARPPDLVLVDAIVAGEGDGPLAVTPRHVGCILASPDPVAADVMTTQLFGFRPANLLHARLAAERGLGRFSPDGTVILGTSLREARVSLRPTTPHLDWLPANLVVGGGVDWVGTLGRFKEVADLWRLDGTWRLVLETKGRPTFVIGDAQDPKFEEHLRQGPYVVLDDAAPEYYRTHPAVRTVPGHPVGEEMLDELLWALGLDIPGGVLQGIRLLRRWAQTTAH